MIAAHWLEGYRRQWLKSDALAGVTTAAVVIPQAMAYATIADADFISQPVLAGFKAGTGLLIAAGQLGKVLGIPQEGDSFFEKVRSALSNVDQFSWPTAALVVATIAALVAVKRWAPAIPGALVAVGAGIVVVRRVCSTWP